MIAELATEIRETVIIIIIIIIIIIALLIILFFKRFTFPFQKLKLLLFVNPFTVNYSIIAISCYQKKNLVNQSLPEANRVEGEQMNGKQTSEVHDKRILQLYKCIE